MFLHQILKFQHAIVMGHPSRADKHHKHVATGDLRIIKSNILRNLFTKRLKFGERKSINFNEAKCGALTDLKKSVLKCSKNGATKKLFSD